MASFSRAFHIPSAFPGLLLSSPATVTDIPDRASVLSANRNVRDPLPGLLDLQRFAVLETTGEGAEHVVRVIERPPSYLERKVALESALVNLWILGGSLLVRDADALAAWRQEDPTEVRVPVPDGFYRIDALWVPSNDANLHVDLFLFKTREVIEAAGWATLGEIW